MKDVALLLVTVGFFAIAWLYARPASGSEGNRR